MPRQKKPAPSFEERMAQLAQLVTELEAGKLPLDASFEAYERGVALLSGLNEELAGHEAKVALLTAKGEQVINIEEGGPS